MRNDPVGKLVILPAVFGTLRTHAHPSHRNPPQILRDRPVVTAELLNLPRLRTLPSDTFGRCYVEFMDSRVCPHSASSSANCALLRLPCCRRISADEPIAQSDGGRTECRGTAREEH